MNDEILDIETLANRIAATAASLDAATHTLLTDIRIFDLNEHWAAQGALSCAHWLNWRCGIALGAAREKIRVAHALAALPLIDDALRLGQVSYSKVRALTRVATAENERKLLDIAAASTASQLEKTCRLLDQMEPPADRPAPARWLRMRHMDDGSVRVEAQLLPEEATRVMQACRASAESSETPDTASPSTASSRSPRPPCVAPYPNAHRSK